MTQRRALAKHLSQLLQLGNVQSRQELRKLCAEQGYSVSQCVIEMRTKSKWDTKKNYEAALACYYACDEESLQNMLSYMISTGQGYPSNGHERLVELCLKKEQFAKLSDVFSQARTCRAAISFQACEAAFSELINRGDFPRSVQIHKYMSDMNIFSEQVYRSIAWLYARYGYADEARRAHQAIKTHCGQEDERKFTTLMQAYLRTGNLAKVFATFDEMKWKKVKPAVRTYVALISAQAQLRNKEAMKNLLREAISQGYGDSTEIYNACLAGLEASGDMKAAISFFEALKSSSGVNPNRSSYSIMIRGYCRHNMIGEAKAMFNELVAMNLKINHFLVTLMLIAFGKAGEVDEALKMFRSMENYGISANSFHYSALISVLRENGRFDEALELFEEVLKAKVPVDEKILLNVMQTHVDRGCFDSVRQLFGEFANYGLRHSTKSYNCLLDAHLTLKQDQNSLRVYFDMIANDVRPNRRTFTIALKLCTLINDQHAAQNILTLAKKLNSVPHNLVGLTGGTNEQSHMLTRLASEQSNQNGALR
eukprot:CAMPEP_0198733334 /NCGR_PEP_ID=MMETSP1475-20131203/44883_1 /TAXON_ID= ORGANISM="Unidentified sp., Strain CCMP1999" /NCGR_SAMPLE_ID=MMETSP1475 /ASSEMBLY_ACC=CAM_ASM_001111 /LENGTH=537 /DNA_ID=CAMNT_0044496617 /DNA_START=118 /DNA_END=1731 /DNA_ORIENTATION=-